MVDNGEGKTFRGVQDRLKMFEQTKVGYMRAEPRTGLGEAHKPEPRLVPPLKKPALKTDELGRGPTLPPVPTSASKNIITKPPLKATLPSKALESPPVKTTAPTVRVNPTATATAVKVPPSVAAPPVKVPPTVAAPPVKVPPSVTAPPIKVPPSVAEPPVKVPPSVAAPPVKVPPSVALPPVKVPPPVAAPAKTPSTKISSTSGPPPLKNPPPSLKPQEVASTAPPEDHAEESISFVPKETVANDLHANVKIPYKASSVRAAPAPLVPIETSKVTPQVAPTVTSEVISVISPKTPHPPAPIPPPERPSDRNKHTCDLEPPPVPPPPPSTGKAHTNIVIGWATPNPSTKKTVPDTEVLNTSGETPAKGFDSNKPPPILVAPPTLESFERVIKCNSNASSFPDEDVEYDEDDEFGNSPWYFDVSKGKATQIMRDCSDIGKFMVRPSDNDQYVLMVRAESEVVKKFKIQHFEGGWVLGDPSNGKRRHASISSLMDFYCKNGVKVGSTFLTLKGPVSRE